MLMGHLPLLYIKRVKKLAKMWLVFYKKSYESIVYMYI